MNKKIVAFLLSICITIGVVGCSVGTAGEASWEIYGGVRTKQISQASAKVEIKSTIVDKIVDLFTGSEKKEDK